MFPLTLRVNLDNDDALDQAWEFHHVSVLNKPIQTEEERKKSCQRINARMFFFGVLMVCFCLIYLCIQLFAVLYQQGKWSGLLFPAIQLSFFTHIFFPYYLKWKNKEHDLDPLIFRSNLWPFWPNTDYFQEVIWRFEENGLSRELRGKEQHFAYTDFSQVHPSPEGLLLYPKCRGLKKTLRKIFRSLPNEFYFIPKEAFPTPEAQDKLAQRFQA